MEADSAVLIYEKCRLCLKRKGVRNIFEECDLTEDIYLCTGIKVSQSDNLPPNICEDCADIIIKAKQLRILAKKNDNDLKILISAESNESVTQFYVSECVSNKRAQKRKLNENTSDSTKLPNAVITVRKDLFENASFSSNPEQTENNQLATENNNNGINCSTERVETTYKCQVCFKVFDKPKKLYLHKRTHNKTEACPLDACNKLFATKSDLEKHFRTHTGEKPYECSICGQRFSQRATLKAHRITLHNS